MGETIEYNIVYNVQDINRVVAPTKSVLYAVNALRLSIKDIELVMRGPTFANVMWTAIQLMRTWTHIRRLIRMATAEQQAFAAQSVATQALVGRMGVSKIGTTRMVGGFPATYAPTALRAAMTGFAITPVTAVAAGIVIGGVAVGAYMWQQQKAKADWLEKQREVARTQGLEP